MKPFTLLILLILIHSGVQAQTAERSSNQYRKADSIARLYDGYSLYNLPELANNLTGQLTDERDKIRAIYTWVSTNISNDFDTYFRNKVKRYKYRNNQEKLSDWNRKVSRILFKNLLTEYKSICSGYAYLVNELAIHTGLKCKIINGYGKISEKEILQKGNPNHAWNAIKIDGEWFFLDTTWSSGIYKIGERKFINEFNDTYFLVSPDLFILNHYPENIIDTHTDLITDPDTFLAGPCVKKAAIQFGIVPFTPKQYNIELNRGEKLVIELGAGQLETVDQITLKINKTVVKAMVTPIDSSSISIEYEMNKTGSFPVQVCLNDEEAILYQVTVEK